MLFHGYSLSYEYSVVNTSGSVEYPLFPLFRIFNPKQNTIRIFNPL